MVPEPDAPPPPTDRAVLKALLHRLGSPLGALVTYLHLASEDLEGDSRARESLDGMRGALRDLRAALEGGRRWLEAAEAPLSAVPRTLDEAVARAARRHAEVRVTSSLDAFGQVACPAALEDLLAELFANAGHAGGATQAHVSASRDADGRLRIAVDDDGRGWAEGGADRAFEPFHRAMSGDPGGARAGCGLAVVALLARRLGGAAVAEPGPRGGARVVVTLATP